VEDNEDGRNNSGDSPGPISAPQTEPLTETDNSAKREIEGTPSSEAELNAAQQKVKFVVYGEEMLEKVVKYSGDSGRVYVPTDWVGKQIKIIRTD